MAYLSIECFKCEKRLGAIVKHDGVEDSDAFYPLKHSTVFCCDDCAHRYGYTSWNTIAKADAEYRAFEASIRADQERIIADAQMREDEFEALPMSRFIRWITRTKPEPISARLRRKWELEG